MTSSDWQLCIYARILLDVRKTRNSYHPSDDEKPETVIPVITHTFCHSSLINGDLLGYMACSMLYAALNNARNL
jgi:hypothetical protein